MSEPNENTRICRRALEELFEHGDFDSLEELIHPDFVNHEAPPGHPQGREGLTVTINWLRGLWGPMRSEIEDEIREDSKVVARVTMHGRLSTTLSDDDASWENSTVIRDDVAAAVRTLKREVERDILVAGSATLARTVMEEGLVDRINMQLYPIVVGTGKRLFTEGIPRAPLELSAVEQVGPDGVLLLTYRPKG